MATKLAYDRKSIRVVLLWVLFAGCSSTHRYTSADAVVVLIEANIRDLDPRFALTSHDLKLSRLVAPGLMTIDSPNLEPVPYLARELVQESRVQWRVDLKEGLQCSDGSAFDVEDVLFTYQSVLVQETGSLYRKGFEEKFESFERLGPYSLRFHLKKPVATFESDLDFGIVCETGAVDPKTARFADNKIVGVGPFRIGGFSQLPQVRAYLERNPHDKLREVPVEGIVVEIVRDSGARGLMLAGGSADFAQNSIRPDLVDDLVEREHLQLKSGPSAILTYLMMNNEDPILQDRRVRQAIALAIDREKIISERFRGRAVLATGLVPPSHWAYNGNVERYRRDLAKANELLDAAGHARDKNGNRFALTYKTSANPFRLAIARSFAKQLLQVGIVVEVRAFEFGTFFRDIKAGNYQLGAMQTAPITDPDYHYSYFHSERIPTSENPHTGNRWRFRNDEVDRLTAQGRVVANRTQRKKIYDRVQEVIADELPVVPLWHEDNIAVLSRRVEGYELSPTARFAALAQTTKK